MDTPKISRSGDRIAFFTRDPSDDRMKIVNASIANPKDRILYPLPIGSTPTGKLTWTRNDGSLLYTIYDSRLVSDLWEQPVNSHASRQLTHFPSSLIFSFDLSSDLSRISMIRGSWSYKLVVMKKNLSPAS